jgi:hypothetical protein
MRLALLLFKNITVRVDAFFWEKKASAEMKT